QPVAKSRTGGRARGRGPTRGPQGQAQATADEADRRRQGAAAGAEASTGRDEEAAPPTCRLLVGGLGGGALVVGVRCSFRGKDAGAAASAAAWEHIVEGLRGLNGEAPQFMIDEAAEAEAEAAAPTALPMRPKGMDAVRQIVAERPGRWTLRELRAEFERRGWL